MSTKSYVNGFDQDGFDRDGADRDGFDRDGFNYAGYNRDGLNLYGFLLSEEKHLDRDRQRRLERSGIE